MDAVLYKVWQVSQTRPMAGVARGKSALCTDDQGARFYLGEF